MRIDEIEHGAAAQRLGAAVPAPVQALMSVMGKVMTSTAYYI
jgi:ubiquinone biosynthesis monooxygenase Coq7